MTVVSGVDVAGERSATEDGPAGDDDVTITIRGQTASRMLTRGDALARELREAMRALGERLDRIEAAATERAAEQIRLNQLVRELEDKVVRLGGQAGEQAANLQSDLGQQRAALAQLQADLARVGRGLDDHGRRFGSVENDVSRLGAFVNDLRAKVAALPAVGQPAAEEAAADGATQPQAQAGTAPGGRNILAGAAARLRNLHLGLW